MQYPNRTTPDEDTRIVDFWNRRRHGLSNGEWQDFYALVARKLMATRNLPDRYRDQQERRNLIIEFFDRKIFRNAETSTFVLETAHALEGFLRRFSYDVLEQERIQRASVSYDDGRGYDPDDESTLAEDETAGATDATDEDGDAQDDEDCADGTCAPGAGTRHLLSEAGIDLDAADDSAAAFWKSLDEAEQAYLALNICAEREDHETLISIKRRLGLGSNYDYKARRLGVTGEKGGFFRGYEKTKLGGWLVSVGAQISHEWKRELLALLVLLCRHAPFHKEAQP